ncbi:hypothetical protein MRB53_028123 [Persea americana]|uniref:Uncharacterized protein n=1 Tax=Persea americana TaxID=3435 RepID=A0ACC2KEQ5_PERAE|nr:hypothetical protein MRB53_028123 [Persea americana]
MKDTLGIDRGVRASEGDDHFVDTSLGRTELEVMFDIATEAHLAAVALLVGVVLVESSGFHFDIGHDLCHDCIHLYFQSHGHDWREC